MIKVGQVWQDGSDLLFVTAVEHSDDFVIVRGTAILSGIETNYTCYLNSEDNIAALNFGQMVFEPIAA